VLTPHLLLHLPEKGKHLTSSPKAIEEYRSLVQERGYTWLCKPGSPLDQSLCQELGSALEHNEQVYVFLFVRLSLDARSVALYRARLVDLEGPGPNADTEHVLPGLHGRSCGTWLKLINLKPIAAKRICRLLNARTGEPVPIWTDLRTNSYLVTEGEPATAEHRESGHHCWLLCINHAPALTQFQRTWRYQPVATYQPGSAEFIAERQEGTPQRVLVHDRVFGSPTYLALIGIYEVADLLTTGTAAGALVYAVQLREVMSFSSPPQLDPRQPDGLWSQLDSVHSKAVRNAVVSGNQVLVPLSGEDCRRILSQVGSGMDLEAMEVSAVEMARSGQDARKADARRGATASSHIALRTALDVTSTKPVADVTQVDCYHLLRVLERALRDFIDHELSRISEDWWAEERLPLGTRRRAEERKQKREHSFPWLSQQNLPAKEYLDFSDYAEIITMECNWNDVFQPMFSRKEVIRGKLIEISMLRNDIAHMRELRPLDKEAFISLARQLLLTVCDHL
jgi:hypothetical protein